MRNLKILNLRKESKQSLSLLESIRLWKQQRTSSRFIIIQKPLNSLLGAILPIKMLHLKTNATTISHPNFKNAKILNKKEREDASPEIVLVRTQVGRHWLTN